MILNRNLQSGLCGFFTSIPVERIIAAIQWLIDRYLSKRRADLETVLFSVDIKEKDTKLTQLWTPIAGWHCFLIFTNFANLKPSQEYQPRRHHL